MAYLDVSPMMASMRNAPEEFEVSTGWLHHVPSRHYFKFDPGGGVQLRAACNCVYLSVSTEQERELTNYFREWQASYWRPLQINNEFASHFRTPSLLQRILIDLTARLHRWALRLGRDHGAREGIIVPAE